MASEQGTCPIWAAQANRSYEDYHNIIHVNSTRAGGLYTIFKRDKAGAEGLSPIEKAKLTSWIIDQHLAGIDDPKIDCDIIANVTKRRSLSVAERAERLLKHLQSRSRFIGDKVRIRSGDQDDGMLAWSESYNMHEVFYLLDHLIKRGFVEEYTQTYADLLSGGSGFGSDEMSGLKPDDQLPPALAQSRQYAISPGGYAYLTSRAADTAKAFVAMWFHSSMEEAYEHGMRPAIKDAGYTPIRIDRKDHNNKIDDEIIAEIRRSRFLVADFTQGESGARGGVYYEAGFAHGLNIPVIFACRDDVIDKVHFDTRQYNHIVWDTPGALRDKLAKRISATIGDGPYKKSNS